MHICIVYVYDVNTFSVYIYDIYIYATICTYVVLRQ